VSDRVPPFDFSRLTREDLAARGGKVTTAAFGRPSGGGSSFADWFDRLPRLLAGQDLRDLVEAIVAARSGQRAVHLAMGAHTVKVGLGPILADLIARDIVTAVSVNGAFIIHDFEIATAGFTSEDVGAVLGQGSFGMSKQTAEAFVAMVDLAEELELGLGEAAARHIAFAKPPHGHESVLAACYHHNVPVTAHVALGADIVHMAAELDGAKLGRALLRDFRTFTTLVGRLEDGVYLNVGSAVVLPEVFLKAVSAVRNTGVALRNLTTANLDFIRQYRPLTNVVQRPTADGGKGINLVGHHEIMIPLLATAVCRRLWDPAEDE